MRNRFTIAHEFGHFILHKSVEQGLFVDKGFRMMFRGTSSNSNSSPQIEREANHFAACILMPEHLMKEELERLVLDYTEDDAIEVLAKKSGVSKLAMSYRMSNLSIQL